MLRSKTLDIDWDKRRYRTYCILIFILLMLDYLLTYYGVSYLGIVREANPLMVWLFEIPFNIGLTIRLFMVAIVLHLSNSIYDIEPDAGIKIAIINIIINMVPLYSHIKWISYYSFLFF